MNNYITIDSGTTNTRIGLLNGDDIVDTVYINVGAKVAMDNRGTLVSSIEQGIKELRKKHKDIKVERILCAGMLTSEFGLYELNHITLPVGINELHKNIYNTEMFGLPITFIPGVKSVSEDFLKTDMMRGEETELIGIMSQLPEDFFQNSVIVLPGSHSKFIYTDNSMRITAITSLLTGEMLAALSQNTILKDAVTLKSDGFSSDFLIKGYTCCSEMGINASLLKVRILKNLFNTNENERYSFFLGIVLQPEIQKLIECKAEKIIIAGRKQIKEPMTILLNMFSNKQVIAINDEVVQRSVFIGMKNIYEYKSPLI